MNPNDEAFDRENTPVLRVTKHVRDNKYNAFLEPELRNALEELTNIHCENENISIAKTDVLIHNNRRIESLAKRNVMHNRVQSDVVSFMSRVETLETENTTLKARVNMLETENTTLKARVSILETHIETLETENTTLKAGLSTMESKTATLEARFEALEAKNSCSSDLS